MIDWRVLLYRFLYPATLLPAYIILVLSGLLAARQAGVSLHTLKKAVSGELVGEQGCGAGAQNFWVGARAELLGRLKTF